ncbi:HNH endonuclease [Flavobacterium sp.]|uniref:HNH endonuclease n=1 Tax=Flavobacterium sp. TaxID=239 RepID=UPI0025B7ADDD|nr:HNH endonuclease [Flavobacterium sp.]
MKPEIDKNLAIEIMRDLKIDKRRWRRSSRHEKSIMHKHWMSQNRFKHLSVENEIREKRNKITNYNKLIEFNKSESHLRETLKDKIEKLWKDLSFEERIDLIAQEKSKELKTREKQEALFEKLQRERNEQAAKKASEKQLEDEKNRFLLDEENRKKAEELALVEKREKEERLKMVEARRQLELEERKKRRDEQFKERIKRDILEKERKKQLESDAIQELIESGKLSHNFSIKNVRVPIPSHIMQAVWKRDMECCVNCASSQSLEFDHIIPVAKGGSNSINNIQLLCQSCNRKKSSKIM